MKEKICNRFLYLSNLNKKSNFENLLHEFVLNILGEYPKMCQI